jgi:hypothetical protein
MRESPYLAEIRRLDPVRDHVRIVHLDACYEFPFDTTRALELAFSRTFAVPSIAQLLASTGEFTDRALNVFGKVDDAPGLVLLGILLIVSACALGVRAAQHGR